MCAKPYGDLAASGHPRRVGLPATAQARSPPGRRTCRPFAGSEKARENDVRSIIFIDTNIWLSTNLLRTPESVSFLSHIEQTQSKILFTSLLRHEVETNANIELQKAHRSAKEAVRALDWRSGLASSSTLVPLPTGVASLASRLDRLKTVFHSPEPAESVFRRAHSRVVQRLAPSHGQNQQYKDAFLLEELLCVEGFERRILISQDGDFWTTTKPPVLHSAVMDGAEVIGFQNLRSFLDEHELVEAVELEEKHRVEIAALGYTWVIGDARDQEIYLRQNNIRSAAEAKYAAFHTSEPATFAVDFEIPLFGDVEDIDGERHLARLTLIGSLLIDRETVSISDFTISRSRLETDSEVIADVDWNAQISSSLLRPRYRPIIQRAKTAK